MHGDSAIHVVLGDHAERQLGGALGRDGLDGRVHCIRDDLGHGPLHDGVARIAYMRACYDGFDVWTHAEPDLFSSWRMLEQECTRYDRDVVIWAGDNASEGVLAAMTCWWLRESSARLHMVELPDGAHAGSLKPTDLARAWLRSRQLDATERRLLASRFVRLRDAADQRRRWTETGAQPVPISFFDQLLESALSCQWQPARHVVRQAMRAAEPRDGLSDLFLSSRLVALIGGGRVDADSRPRRLSDYAVRCSAV